MIYVPAKDSTSGSRSTPKGPVTMLAGVRASPVSDQALTINRIPICQRDLRVVAAQDPPGSASASILSAMFTPIKLLFASPVASVRSWRSPSRLQ